ncbi:hypothetical protein N2152v2_009682 [Parachlorella kessleri]
MDVKELAWPRVWVAALLLAALYAATRLQPPTAQPATGSRLTTSKTRRCLLLHPGPGETDSENPSWLSKSSGSRSGHCREAYATLLTDESYTKGTLALVWGLKRYATRPRAVVVILPQAWKTERPAVADQLLALGAAVVYAPPVPNPYEQGLYGIGQRFGSRNGSSVMMKLHAWALTAFSRVLLVDSDQVVLQSYDRIFDRYQPHPVAAGPGTYDSSEHFSTATMLLTPNLTVYVDMLAQLGRLESYDSADMGFLNAYFSDYWGREARNFGSLSRLPWWLVPWRRVVAANASLWEAHRHKAVGLECSGPIHEKPWGSKWREQGPYLDVYERWWRLYNESLELRAMAVCSAWRDSLHPRKWPLGRLALDGLDGDNEHLVLETLSIETAPQVMVGCLPAIYQFPHLRRLDLDCEDDTTEAVHDVSLNFKALAPLTALEELGVSGWGSICWEGAAPLLPRITQLQLGCSEDVTLNTALPSLQRLRLYCASTVVLAPCSLRSLTLDAWPDDQVPPPAFDRFTQLTSLQCDSLAILPILSSLK